MVFSIVGGLLLIIVSTIIYVVITVKYKNRQYLRQFGIGNQQTEQPSTASNNERINCTLVGNGNQALADSHSRQLPSSNSQEAESRLVSAQQVNNQAPSQRPVTNTNQSQNGAYEGQTAPTDSPYANEKVTTAPPPDQSALKKPPPPAYSDVVGK